MTSKEAKRVEERKKEIEKALNETIEDTIKQAGPMNALAWTGVTLGAFLLNLLVLVAVTGG